jgi:ribosome-binding factor A
MSYRIKKINSLIKNELSLVLLNKIQDPALGIVTITSVKVSPDIRSAKIYVSVYQKEQREEILEKLNGIKGLIRTQLAQRINLRRVPELNFFIDDTLDYVAKMEDLFQKIRKDDIEKT